MTLSPDIVVIGALTGLTYAVLAAGLVLVYRATKVINFAHGEIGAFAAAILAKLVLDLHWPYFAAFASVLVIGGALGGLIELTVVRRLFGAPRLVLLVATIGVAQLVFFGQAVLPDISHAAPFPEAFDRRLEIGGVLLLGQHFMAIATVPAVMLGLAYFLNRTPYGVAIRATANNPDGARLAGINVKRVSTVVWVLGGVLATAAVVVASPIRGVLVGGTFAAGSSLALGPSLLLRALAAGLVGQLRSLPLALAGGVAIGVVEAVLLVNVSSPRFMDFLLFLVVLGLVVLRGRQGAGGESGGWALVAAPKPIPARLLSIWWVRHLPHLTAAAGFVVAAAIPLTVSSSSRMFLITRVLLYAMVALSVLVVLGWAGQLSLCQFAFVGLGAVTTAALSQRGMPFGPAVVAATCAGVLAALVIGVPALRVKGLFLAVTSLAFAIAAGGYLLTREFFFGATTIQSVRRGSLGPFDLNSHRTYYYLCLLVCAASALGVARLRRTGVGRRIIAVRENEEAAAALTVSPMLAKLTAFGLSGGLAALAGALLGGLQIQVSSQAYPPELSLQAVAMTIIGGLGSVTGALLGAVYVIGLPSVFSDSPEVRLLTSGAGLLVMLMYFPTGLLGLVHRLRDALLGLAERRVVPSPPTGPARVAPPARTTVTDRDEPADNTPALRVTDVTVHFGGLVAVDGVSLEVGRREIVGLIGTNGAGKSTLMNVVSGFLTPTSGRLEIFGHDVTRVPAHLRARLGAGRVFQDARLFGDLTVREAVRVALESRESSELVPSMLGLPPSRRAERRKDGEAAELIAFVGLGRYADARITELSTGTRRIAELACLLALDARLLLLDEPTAGVAQREAEAFGPLVQEIARVLDASVLLIEHDMPLVLGVSDRIYCLGAGRVIASGAPLDVRDDPDVIASYLGTDDRAIARSGVATILGAST